MVLRPTVADNAIHQYDDRLIHQSSDCLYITECAIVSSIIWDSSDHRLNRVRGQDSNPPRVGATFSVIWVGTRIFPAHACQQNLNSQNYYTYMHWLKWRWYVQKSVILYIPLVYWKWLCLAFVLFDNGYCFSINLIHVLWLYYTKMVPSYTAIGDSLHNLKLRRICKKDRIYGQKKRCMSLRRIPTDYLTLYK